MALTVLFDLDGTITEPAEGITKSIRHALEKMGRPVEAGDDLKWCIGPPLRGTFPKLLGTTDVGQVEEAIRLYRERYRETGIFAATMYAGIEAVLPELAGRYRLFVATAKPHDYAGKVLEHFGVRKYFAGVYGPELNGKFDDKTELVAHMIEREKIVPAEIVMVGDRWSDMAAAVKNGGRGIGALWGYGSEKELREAGAATIIETVAETPGAIEKMSG